MARTASLGRLSVSDLQAEISRRQRTVSKLVKARNRLLTKLTKLERQIADAGGDVGARRGGMISGRRRAKNEHSLSEALHNLLKGKTMSVTDAAQKVQDAGYKTTSPSFRTIVNQTLINHGSLFKRVGRGQYTSK